VGAPSENMSEQKPDMPAPPASEEASEPVAEMPAPPASEEVSEPAAERPAPPEEAGPARIPSATVLAAAAGLAAAWLAAGSTGLLGHALRHALTWLALGVALAAVWPSRTLGLRRLLLVAAGLAVALVMTPSRLVPVNVFAVALWLGVLATTRQGMERRVLVLASSAVGVLGIYRLALTSIPFLWLAADGLGAAIGRRAGSLAGQPLSVGATFAGLDFLVAMAALYILWLIHTAPPRWPRALYAALAIVGAHFAYLAFLAYTPALLGPPLPPPPPPSYLKAFDPPVWTWEAAFHSLLPWNLPALAGILYLAIAAGMLRWARWSPVEEPASDPGEPFWRRRPVLCLWAASVVLALLLPAVTTLCLGKADLSGKKVVAYEKGFLNWLKPKHGEYGRLSIGMYGMLPTLVDAHGGSFLLSPNLSEEDLAGADVLIILFPNKPWEEGQLDRIWSFVRRGGSLVFFGDHTTRFEDGGNRFDELLAPTVMRIAYDSSMFTVGGWLQSYETLAHPITAGVRDDRNQFGVVIGASVEARWPARPLLVGRWGWNDPGDPGSGAAQMGNREYDPGERLGDVLLATEQPLGAGKVIAFGDTSSITNGICIGSHAFIGRLLAYLAGGVGTPQAPWRGVLGLLAALALAGALGYRAEGWRSAAIALAFCGSLALCTHLSARAAQVLPDGRRASPNNLAYIDTSHVERFSEEATRPDGTMGIAMTLMRNGYLAYNLPEFSAERLERAGLFVSIAPTKEFTRAERRILKKFVEDGGILISTVGYDARGPSRAMLADFGFYIGGAKAGDGVAAHEPEPLGHFKAPYLNTGEYMCFVRFHAAWPIECTESDAKPVAYGANNTMVIIERQVGKGKVVVVGDTGFAMNKNLEHEGGELFDGMRENADFWRYYLPRLRGQHPWIPPKQIPNVPPSPGPTPRKKSSGK